MATGSIRFEYDEGHDVYIVYPKWKIESEKPKGDWELYDLSVDRCEQNNLAKKEPERVRQMAARWKELDDRWQRDAARK